MKREIIHIDEAKCTGCGLCIPNCPEGALQVIDGKARLVSDLSCDGLGACVGHCPEDAISIQEREAEPYDECKVMENIVKAGPNVIKAHLDHLREHGQDGYLAQALTFLKNRGIPEPPPTPAGQAHSCPGMKMIDLREGPEGRDTGQAEAPLTGGSATGKGGTTRGGAAPAASAISTAKPQSQLRQWPVQLHLLNPRAPCFKDADLLIAADCVPFSYANFHERFLKGKVLIIFCPKLDDATDLYVEKLAEIFKHNNIKSVTVLHMEVPCCFGTTKSVEEGLQRSGKNIPIRDYTISIRGEII
jgi:NAD-dependent dihydropyrimidine dehydrogenase PreA subunit